MRRSNRSMSARAEVCVLACWNKAKENTSLDTRRICATKQERVCAAHSARYPKKRDGSLAHRTEKFNDKSKRTGRVTHTSIHASSLPSAESSFVLAPLTATRLLGGAISSALPSGLFLSSIFGRAEGRGEGDGVVATGIRKRPHEPARLRKRAPDKSNGRLEMIEMPKSKRLGRVAGCDGLTWM